MIADAAKTAGGRASDPAVSHPELARGSAGGVIMPHRTLVTLPLRQTDVAIALGLTLAFMLLAFVAVPMVFALWRGVLLMGANALALDARLDGVPWPLVGAAIPALVVHAPVPERLALVIGLAVLVFLLVAARVIGTRALPLSYFLRAVALVLGSSIVVFTLGVRPASLDLPTFTRTMMKVNAGIWLFVPLGYGLTLFLLDIGWTRKALLMAIALLHLALFIPVQQLVIMYVVKHLTLLVVPLVFVFASVLPLIAILIALYSWGASWPERRA
jgi:hypothetical protein